MVLADTVITKTASGTIADLVVGQNITASGAEESGVVVVTSLQIRPTESLPR